MFNDFKALSFVLNGETMLASKPCDFVTIAMIELTTLTTAASKPFLETFAPYFAAFVSLFAILLGFWLHDKKVLKEKVIEKEVAVLYEAHDAFFAYADAANLYFSLAETGLASVVKPGMVLPHFFDQQFLEAYQTFYREFRSVKKAAFLLRGIGQDDAADLLDQYFEATTGLSKTLFSANSRFLSGELSLESQEAVTLAAALCQDIVTTTATLKESEIVCLKAISGIKEALKNQI